MYVKKLSDPVPCLHASRILAPFQFSSVAELCLTLCNPMDTSTPSFPVYHKFLELGQTHVHRVSMPSKHLILHCPLLFLPSIFPSIRGFSNESTLRIRWPKDWRFSFSISPSNKYSGLISFRIDGLDLLTVLTQRDLRESSPTPQFKASILRHSAFFIVQFSHPYMTTGKTIALTIWTLVCARRGSAI